MNNKIYLIINIPMLETKFEILVPPSKDYLTFSVLLTKALNELTDGYFPLKKIELINTRNNETYSEDTIIKEMNLKNGDELIAL